TLAGSGADAWGVDTDAQGMIPESLVDTWEELNKQGLTKRVKAIYIVPYFDNPRGVSMPTERRQKVLELAEKWSQEVGHRIYLISDEAYRGLQYEGDPIPSTLVHDDAGASVVSAGTFSKVFSPGIRVGWGILPKTIIRPMCDMKGNIDFGSPNFSQHLITEVLKQGLLAPHLESLKQTYREKRAAMLAAAEEFLSPLAEVEWDRPHGGLYVWLRLPEMVDAGPDGSLLQRAQDLGVLYVPGQYCFAANGAKVQRNTIRLSFGVQSCENIREGIRLLAEAIRTVV
ncbi:MAG: 2-aminoadipate transaminase, partial [Pirellulaceae bacterium]